MDSYHALLTANCALTRSLSGSHNGKFPQTSQLVSQSFAEVGGKLCACVRYTPERKVMIAGLMLHESCLGLPKLWQCMLCRLMQGVHVLSAYQQGQ